MLTGGELVINKNLDIEGPGANKLTVSGNHASRVFDIGGGVTVTIAGLTIANGQTIADHSVDLPAGSAATGRRRDSQRRRCQAEPHLLCGGQQPGVRRRRSMSWRGPAESGTANVSCSTFTGNKAMVGGGSTFFAGSAGRSHRQFGGGMLNVADSTFKNNEAVGAGKRCAVRISASAAPSEQRGI